MQKGKHEVISFDITNLNKEELREIFKDLPLKSLKQWLHYYIGKEQYEICMLIKEYIDQKSK